MKKLDFAIWFAFGMMLIAVVVAVTGLAPPFIWTSTKYAPGYSEKQFEKLQIGVTEQEVRQALGAPLWQYTNATSYGQMLYSLHGGGSLYFHRRLLEISNGLVIQKSSYLDYD
jgi:hypothetical protein